MQHPTLKPAPTLADIQAYVEAVLRHRGFDKETVQDKLLMLCEEVGELAKAFRKQNGIKTASDSKEHNIAHEAADVLWLLICVCNHMDIDLEQALRDKEEKNKQRVWK